MRRLIACVGFGATLCAATTASAQIFESVGVRAEGLGGAFVALADDSTATWWNPAGIAGGPFFSGIVERGYVRGTDESTLGVSFAVPSLGVSFYRVRVTDIRPTEPSAGDRQDQGSVLTTHAISQFGVTVGQSLGDHLVLASTVKLARADNTKTDLDIGGMLKFGAFRLGAVVKHLYEPELLADGVRVGLDRQARVGLAYAQSQQRPVVVNLALDGDLTTASTEFGSVRHLAAGAELVAQRRLGIRGGVSVNTVDTARTAVSVGASAAVQKGTFIDARITRGDDDTVRGWGVDLRLTF
jgi:hypothetical protein